MITDKERAIMANDIEKLCAQYEAQAIRLKHGCASVKFYGLAESMAENYRALARALREGKPFEAVA